MNDKKLKIIDVIYSQVKCEKVTPWWAFFSKDFWRSTNEFNFILKTNLFTHSLSARAGVEFDKRSGPGIVGLVYPKWGDSYFLGKYWKKVKGFFGKKEEHKFNQDLYSAMIFWHDCIFHDIDEDLPFAFIGEIFDKLSEEAGFSDLRGDLGEYFTTRYGKGEFGGEDPRSVKNRALITSKTEWV